MVLNLTTLETRVSELSALDWEGKKFHPPSELVCIPRVTTVAQEESSRQASALIDKWRELRDALEHAEQMLRDEREVRAQEAQRHREGISAGQRELQAVRAGAAAALASAEKDLLRSRASASRAKREAEAAMEEAMGYAAEAAAALPQGDVGRIGLGATATVSAAAEVVMSDDAHQLGQATVGAKVPDRTSAVGFVGKEKGAEKMAAAGSGEGAHAGEESNVNDTGGETEAKTLRLRVMELEGQLQTVRRAAANASDASYAELSAVRRELEGKMAESASAGAKEVMEEVETRRLALEVNTIGMDAPGMAQSGKAACE